jgi:polyisoprenoid-binding protein YceI
MTLIIRIMTGLLAIFFLAGLSHAAPSEWRVDSGHSGLYFDIRHIYATVRGHFNDFSGKILFDSENKLTGSCEFEAAVKSIDTNINQRDTHLRSNDFFAAKDFPTIQFKSTQINQTEDNRFEMVGNLTIKDETRKVKIPFVFYEPKDNPANPKEQVAGFEGEFVIDRLEYHVGSGKFYEMGLIDKEVRITVSLEVLKE